MTICGGILFAVCTNAAGNGESTGQRPLDDAAEVGHPARAAAQPGIDYTPLPLERLIGTADLAVIGTVAGVDDDSLSIRIDETLQRQPVAELIVVRKEEPPGIFAPRAVPYGKGQQFVFFLAKSAGQADERTWSILGYPIAGELPVEAGFVYFDSYDIDEFGFETFEVHGVTRPMQRFELGEFKDAVKTYRDCFSWSQIEKARNKRVTRRWEPEIVCDKATLQSYRDRSPIHDYLARVSLRQVPDNSEQR